MDMFAGLVAPLGRTANQDPAESPAAADIPSDIPLSQIGEQ